MKLVVIAGPQSSGKTTSLSYLNSRYQDQLDFHSEINQNTIFPSTKLGSIAVTTEMEKEIIRADIQHIHDLTSSSRLQLIETSLFHLVYSHHLAPDFYQEARKGYQKALSLHDLHVIFIDTQPAVSFARRNSIYQKRVDNQIQEDGLDSVEAKRYSHTMMQKYRTRIEDLHPIWHQVLDEVDYAKSKIVIENNHSNQDQFLQEVDQAFLNLLNL